MNEYKRNEVVSGAFVTLAIVLFAVLAFRVVGPETLGIGRSKEVAYVTHLRNAAGLEPGAPVVVAGITMGSVRSIELTQDRPGPRNNDWITEARIVFVIAHDGLNVDPQTASARVSNHGLLGSRFLAIDPGDRPKGDAPPPNTTDHPIAIRGVDAPTMASVLGEVGPAIADAKRLIDNLDTLVTENDPLLRDALTELTDTADHMRDTIDSLATRVEEVLGSMASTIDENRSHITALLEDLAQTSKVARDKIGQVGDDAEHLLTLGGDLLEDNGPQVSETLRRLRRTMWEAEIAMRKIRANPAVLLFGDDEKLYDPTDYDQTWLRDTGRAGPYEQRDE